jgi:hypothetical protein
VTNSCVVRSLVASEMMKMTGSRGAGEWGSGGARERGSGWRREGKIPRAVDKRSKVMTVVRVRVRPASDANRISKGAMATLTPAATIADSKASILNIRYLISNLEPTRDSTA